MAALRNAVQMLVAASSTPNTLFMRHEVDALLFEALVFSEHETQFIVVILGTW